MKKIVLCEDLDCRFWDVYTLRSKSLAEAAKEVMRMSHYVGTARICVDTKKLEEILSKWDMVLSNEDREIAYEFNCADVRITCMNTTCHFQYFFTSEGETPDFWLRLEGVEARKHIQELLKIMYESVGGAAKE